MTLFLTPEGFPERILISTGRGRGMCYLAGDAELDFDICEIKQFVTNRTLALMFSCVAAYGSNSELPIN